VGGGKAGGKGGEEREGGEAKAGTGSRTDLGFNVILNKRVTSSVNYSFLVDLYNVLSPSCIKANNRIESGQISGELVFSRRGEEGRWFIGCHIEVIVG